MYAKVYASMWDGTLGEHWEAWTTFVFMLANCDREGWLDMTPEAIARRSGLPLEAVKRGIAILEAPDPHSRSRDMDGCRLERIDDHRDWGWRIVNYERYRTLIDVDLVRAQNRERQRKRRERIAAQRASRDVTESHAPSRHAEADAEVLESTPFGNGAALPVSGGVLRREWQGTFGEFFWPAYPRKVNRLEALKAWGKLGAGAATLPELESLAGEIMDGLAWYKATEWQDRPPDKIPHASTWLNQRRYADVREANEQQG